jgi:hypothetical protein
MSGKNRRKGEEQGEKCGKGLPVSGNDSIIVYSTPKKIYLRYENEN